MSVLRSAFGKSTIQGALALIVIVTGSYLAIIGSIDGMSYLAVMLLVAGHYWPRGAGSDSK